MTEMARTPATHGAGCAPGSGCRKCRCRARECEVWAMVAAGGQQEGALCERQADGRRREDACQWGHADGCMLVLSARA